MKKNLKYTSYCLISMFYLIEIYIMKYVYIQKDYSSYNLVMTCLPPIIMIVFSILNAEYFSVSIYPKIRLPFLIIFLQMFTSYFTKMLIKSLDVAHNYEFVLWIQLGISLMLLRKSVNNIELFELKNPGFFNAWNNFKKTDFPKQLAKLHRYQCYSQLGLLLIGSQLNKYEFLVFEFFQVYILIKVVESELLSEYTNGSNSIFISCMFCVFSFWAFQSISWFMAVIICSGSGYWYHSLVTKINQLNYSEFLKKRNDARKT